MPNPIRPEHTLFLLVTCSRDASRRDLAIQVTKNVVELLTTLDITERLIIFDNASTFPSHLDLLPPGIRVCQSSHNIGYWSAIKWVLDHLNELTSFNCDFIYIIESDLIHSDFSALAECELFLNAESKASSVRTQEFSVRHRWRYNKRLRLLPFHVERSQVSLKNVVTGDDATFDRAKGFSRLFISNLHPKLPALHRISLLSSVFKRLASKAGFTEADFFTEAMREKPLIGVLDGGLYHSLTSWSDRANVVSGSYGSTKQLADAGYHSTRACKIQPVNDGLILQRISGD